MKYFKTILIVSIILSVFPVFGQDEYDNYKNEIIGKWMYKGQFKLIFYEDGTGLSSADEGNKRFIDITWKLNKNMLAIQYNGNRQSERLIEIAFIDGKLELNVKEMKWKILLDKTDMSIDYRNIELYGKWKYVQEKYFIFNKDGSAEVIDFKTMDMINGTWQTCN